MDRMHQVFITKRVEKYIAFSKWCLPILRKERIHRNSVGISSC
uniref:Macaca fascicularis brain cDNA, clone: QbsA-11945 n=1 Tax=Macaca fascicularis TaxID=9541 RepID=I7G3Z9_MACFA|nr:unnamed protein product [Macaca fascicularis]